MIVVVMVCDGGDDRDGGHCYPCQETLHCHCDTILGYHHTSSALAQLAGVLEKLARISLKPSTNYNVGTIRD